MRKIISVLIFICMFASLFCACGDDRSGHQHSFTQENTGLDFFVSEATCTSGAKYYYSCLCGEKGTETFELNNETHANISITHTDSNALYHYTKTKCNDCSATISESVELHNYNSSSCEKCNHKKVKGEFEAGLYSSEAGTLVYSWEQLISEGILSVVGEAKTLTLSCNNAERLEGDLIVADDIKMISNMAFMDCDKLIRISLPNTLMSIGAYAFAECDKLENVIIPNGVQEIGNNAFYNCDNFTSITIPASVNSIGGYAFANCSQVTDVVLHNGISSLSSGVFFGMCNLTSINIPETVKSIREYALAGCYGLVSIDYESTVEEWNEIEKNTYWGGYPNRYAVSCVDGTAGIE